MSPFYADLKSRYKSLWIGPVLITWRFEKFWKSLRQLPIQEISVGVYPQGD